MTDRFALSQYDDSPAGQGGAAATGYRLTRRQVLIAGAVFGGLAVLPPPVAGAAPLEIGATPAASAPTTLVAGVVSRVAPPGNLYLGPLGKASRPEQALQIAPGATLCRDGLVGLDAFVPGDEVVAHGSWADAVFMTTDLAPLLQQSNVTITSLAGDNLRTTGGIFRLTAVTAIHSADASRSLGRDQLTGGRSLTMLARRTRPSGAPVAWAIFVDGEN
jgi:hypothetical protein